ncbi:MAG: YbaY family lipoprotein [Phyllobacterium sp.]
MAMRSIAAIVAVLGLLFSAAATVAKPVTVSGTVAYRERIALPPSAVVDVVLLDVSLADAPSKTIAKTRVKPRGGVPVPYRLRFDDAKITPGHRYALRAEIRVKDQLWFTTMTHHPVFNGGKNNTNILVERVRSSKRESGSPAGRWLAEDIRGGGVMDRLQTVLEISANGAISGSGGCNRMSGQARISADGIRFGPITSTEMACTPAAMNQEQTFFAALEDVRGWRIDPMRRKLVLLNAAGRPLIVFARM